MSFIDAARGGADAKVRKCYYVSGVVSTVGVDYTFHLNDQLPSNYVLRIQGSGCISGVLGAANISSTSLIEARLYGAFTTERIYSSNQEGGYVTLGWANPVLGTGDLADGAGQWIFTPAPPVEARSTQAGQWRIRLFDVSTNANVATTAVTAWSFAVDVRAGGPIIYEN